MLKRLLPTVIGTASGFLGILLLVLAIGLAGQTEAPRVEPVLTPVPRPTFPLDTPDVTGEGRRTVDPGADPLVRTKENVAKIVADAAMFFDVPSSTLAIFVDEALEPVPASSGVAFKPPRGAVVDEVFRAHDPLTEPVAQRLEEFLDQDPRPFGPTTLLQPEIAVGIRAAYLTIQKRRLLDHLERRDVHPSEDTAWFLTALSLIRDPIEVHQCIEATGDLSPERGRGCLVEEAPTFEILANPRFVLKAFLGRWPTDEARERREGFLAAVWRVGKARHLIPDELLASPTGDGGEPSHPAPAPAESASD
jgi:hypothetical protein